MDLFLFGAGGHARELADLLGDLPEEERPRIAGLYADWGFDATTWHGAAPQHLGGLEDMARSTPGRFLVAVGDPRARDQVRESLLAAGWSDPPAIVHPTASVARSASLADGAVVFPHARVGVSVTVGPQSHVTVGAILGHDTRLGRSASVLPGAVLSGGVTVGDRVEIGSNATVLPGQTLADDVRVGAGAVVTTSITEPATTVVGVPARALEHR